MTDFYTAPQRTWQDHFGSRPLADRLEAEGYDRYVCPTAGARTGS